MSRTRKVWSGVATTLLLLLTLLTGTALAAGDPVQINFTLEGCRNDGSIILPIGGKYVCPDSAYTTGNLGKGWNELDLVPHRITLNNNSGATESYSFVVAGDHKNGAGTGTGWDVIGSDAMTAPTLNTALSSSGCSAVAVTWNDQVITPPGGGVGGADQTIYRLVTINSQPNNATCVYDYYQRLALGAHNFSGSSLQSNLWNQHLTSTGIGQKRLSLPVGEILPQELDKDMSASQGSDHMWNITKSPSPATLSFENTCDTGQPRSAQVAITVSWERLPAVPGGPITVLTHVYATNPAARVITVNVTDVIRSGTTALDTATSGPINVPANTANYLVLTHQTTVPDGTTNLNDVATATYTDLVTGVPVPGNTTATASAVVQLTGPEKNQTATINDVESITGTGFTFSVDSFSGATGAFDAGYVAGTHTVGPVSWTSASQSGSGSVTFNKTVYVSGPLIIGGNLHDVANLTGSDGFSASAEADVTLSANATVVLTINKNITNVLQGSETATFDFTVKDASDIVVAAPSITFAAGETTKSVVVSGLMPGAYTVSETAPAGWTTQPDKSVSIDLPSCTGSVTFDNPVIAASAKVRKVSDPAGSEAGWVFNLLKDGVQIATATTTGAGSVDFGVQLGEGNYTVVEVAKPGFDQTGSTGCSFTVDLPRDPNPPFECVFTNTQRAKIIVNKVTDPAGDPQSFGFTTTGSGYTPFSLTHGQSNDSGWLVPGNYSVAETVPSGWDLTGSVCGGAAYTPGSTITLDPGETVNCTFTNTKRGRIIIDKVTEPAGHAQLFDFTLTGGPSALNTAFQLADATAPYNSGNIKPGSGYAASETEPFGWKLTGASCSDGSPVSNISVQPGETVTCTFTNSLVPAKVQVKKVTVPAGFEANWTFTLNKDGTPVATATTTGGGPIDFNYDLYSGNYTIVETPQNGWVSDGGVGCTFTVNLPADANQMFSCTLTNTYQPSISFSKTGDALSKIGDSVTYHLALHNTSPSGGPAGVPNLVCSIDDPIIGVSESGRSLAPGASITVHVPFTIPPGASDPFVNTASASCTYPGLSDVVASGTGSHSTNLFQPSVKLTKTGPAYAVVGDIVTYNVTILNTSSADSPTLIGNSFADSLVAGVVPPAACSPLAPGASCNFSYDYTVLMTDPDPLVNTATVHYHPDGFLNDIWDDDTWILDVKYPAKAQVKKVTAPAGFEANWKFDLKKAGVTVATATTTGAGFLDFNYDLYSGNYTIVETSQPGWVSDGGVGCAFTVNLPADDGQMFSCTFTNTYQPSVDLDKTGDTLSKIGDPVDYTITLDNTSLSGPAGAPNLQCSIDDPTIGFSNSVSLAAGESYTANVPFTIPAGASDPFVNTASVSCTYEGLSTPATANASWSTNLFQPSVDITKTGPAYAKEGDTITYNITINNTSSADSPNLILDTFGDTLVAGVTLPAACNELAPGGSCSTSYTYVVPAGAPEVLNNTATVHYHPNGFPNDVTRSDPHIVDIIHPSYTVTKVCKVGIEPVPQEGPALFQITFVNTGDADLVITSDEVTPSTFDLLVDETKTFEVMVNGPFTGQATVPNTVNANAVLNSRYGVSYTEGKTASDYCDVGGRVSVLKLTQGLVNPNMAWDFSLYAGPHQTTSSAFLSSPLASDGTSGKVDGILTFNNYNLNPNRTYTICERNAPASWSSMWKVDTNSDGVVDTIITPYNPNSQDSPPADTGNRCFDFGANTNYPILAGGKLVFEVNNTQPGGEPRTIGFWKNWNICTGGNQAQVAEANGGPEAGWYILENLLPQQEPYMWIGDLKVLNCTQGVRVLSSQEVSTGKNKASDAAYNLASQLLAAKLNESAGAEMCPVAHQAILDGQALLEGTTKVNGKAINFTGVGDYLTSKVKGDLLTLRNMALALANTLDRYNNGNVCP